MRSLFEVTSDPAENHNLAADPAYSDTLEHMAAQLASYKPYVRLTPNLFCSSCRDG